MKTLSEIIEWLQTPDKLPVILVEIPDLVLPGSTTLYLSNSPYSTRPTDILANIQYLSCIVGGVNFTENLSLTGGISLNYGDIELDNTEGSRDSWLYDYIWANKTIQMYIGDTTWSRDDFRLIFNGTIVDISSRSANSLNIIISDRMQELNNPISETLISDLSSNSEVLVPVTFGEVFNVVPISSSTNVNTLEYQVHTGAIENIIEVRDNGVPISVTKNIAAGKFTLNQNPYGEITCSVQGHKTTAYYNDIANIIKVIVKNFGPSTNRLIDADIDLTNFSNFSSSYPQPVGVYVSSRENILTICNKLASSIGAQLTFSSDGYLKLVTLDLPPSGGAVYNVTSNDFEYNSLSIVDKSDIRASTKIAYCKNYTVQSGNIAAGVPSNNKALFTQGFLIESVVDATVQSDYKLTSEPDQEEVSLLKKTDAIAEATRRNNLWKVPRFVISFKAYGHLLPVELGDTINLTDSRFGLEATKSGLVVSLSKNWLNNRVTIGILV